MINDRSKDHFTEQDMIDFWLLNCEEATIEDYVSGARLGKEERGLYLSGANSVMIIENGGIHSAAGPAFITMYPHLKKPAARDYYLDGIRLNEDSLRRRVLVAKYKQDQKQTRSKLWL